MHLQSGAKVTAPARTAGHVMQPRTTERFRGLAPDGGGLPDIIELAQRHGLSLRHASERVAIVHASREVASHLQIAPGADVLKLNRIVETADGEPVEWRVTFKKFERLPAPGSPLSMRSSPP